MFGAQGARRSRWPSSPRWSSRALESPRCASAAWGCGGAGRAGVRPSTAPLPVPWVAVRNWNCRDCALRGGRAVSEGVGGPASLRRGRRAALGPSPRLRPAPPRPHPPAAGTDERDAAAAPRKLRPLSPARITPQRALSPACPQVHPTSHPCGQSGERGDARPRSDPCRHRPAWQRLLARAGQRVRVGGHTATPRPRPGHRDARAGLPRSWLRAVGGHSRPGTPTPLAAPGAPGSGDPAALHHHPPPGACPGRAARGVPDAKAPSATRHSPGSPGPWSGAATWPVRW